MYDNEFMDFVEEAFNNVNESKCSEGCNKEGCKEKPEENKSEENKCEKESCKKVNELASLLGSNF